MKSKPTRQELWEDDNNVCHRETSKACEKTDAAKILTSLLLRRTIVTFTTPPKQLFYHRQTQQHCCCVQHTLPPLSRYSVLKYCQTMSNNSE